MKIKDLRDGMKRVDVEGRVIEKSNIREVSSRYRDLVHRIATATLADETGRISLVLWNEQIDKINVGDRVGVRNAYITSFRGEIMLNVGKYGQMSGRSIGDGQLYTI